MRRDMDLIRELLLRLEAMDLRAGSIHMIDFTDPLLVVEDFSFDEVYYHLKLVIDAGLTQPHKQGMNHFVFSGLSWQGHDFLESVRDTKIWQETKEAAKRTGAWSIEMLGAIAKAIAKDQLRKIGINLS